MDAGTFDYPEFAGRHVLITGGAQGIGRATAALFARSGAHVTIADRDAVAAAQTATAIAADAAHAPDVIALDLADHASVDDAVRLITARSVGLDVLANVAGIFPMASFADTTDVLLSQVMAVNFDGIVRLSRGLLPTLRASSCATIVNVASGAAFRAVPHLGAYSASKAALVAISRSMALELAPSIRVNVVAPGPIASVAVLTLVGGEGTGSEAEAARAAAAAGIALGRLGEPEEVASAIAFLASPRSAFVTGETLHVNGGLMMK